MEPQGGPSVLVRLERAELTARERRLAAAARAERIIAEARERAAAIGAGADERVSVAVEQLRGELRSMADAEIARIERTESDAVDATPGGDAKRSETAIRLIVAAMLGEPPASAVMPGLDPARPSLRRRMSGGVPCS